MATLFLDPILLEPDSLYICLTRLLTPGSFYWSLYTTNSDGIATRHHWTEVLIRQFSWQPAERYQHGLVNPVLTLGKGGGDDLNLVFTKIEAFTAPKCGPSYYPTVFVNVFPDSCESVKENRDRDVSCRTWVIAALQKLREKGFVDLSKEEVDSVERYMISQGKKAEQLVAQHQFAKSMVTVYSSAGCVTPRGY